MHIESNFRSCTLALVNTTSITTSGMWRMTAYLPHGRRRKHCADTQIWPRAIIWGRYFALISVKNSHYLIATMRILKFQTTPSIGSEPTLSGKRSRRAASRKVGEILGPYGFLGGLMGISRLMAWLYFGRNAAWLTFYRAVLIANNSPIRYMDLFGRYLVVFLWDLRLFGRHCIRNTLRLRRMALFGHFEQYATVRKCNHSHP